MEFERRLTRPNGLAGRVEMEEIEVLCMYLLKMPGLAFSANSDMSFSFLLTSRLTNRRTGSHLSSLHTLGTYFKIGMVCPDFH
jgi:hypothetical protein